MDIMPVLLLLLVAMAVSTGTAMVLFTVRSRRHEPLRRPVIRLPPSASVFSGNYYTTFLSRPSSWLAVKSRNLPAVQAAFGLHHVKPCSWIEGLAGVEKLFIAPPVKGR